MERKGRNEVRDSKGEYQRIANGTVEREIKSHKRYYKKGIGKQITAKYNSVKPLLSCVLIIFLYTNLLSSPLK